MRRWLWAAALGVAAAVTTDAAAGPKPAEGTCDRHGTAVEFFATPRQAAAEAKRGQKLVFVLHVSGHFETPEFT